MMMKAHRHLTDDELIERCLAGETHDGDGCGSCEARQADLATLLHEIGDSATQEADAAFSAERLSRQHARILQRIEQDGRPGRLIAFPNHGAEGVPLRARPSSRWIAAAAVAGLVIGLLAGHLAHDLPGTVNDAPVLTRVTDASGGTLRAVATTFSEDEFLGQIESIAERPGGEALLPLHDLTPRAWEVK
jgi:hypothetical protein